MAKERLMTKIQMMRKLAKIDNELSKMIDSCIEGGFGHKKFALLSAIRRSVFHGFINITRDDADVVVTDDMAEILNELSANEEARCD